MPVGAEQPLPQIEAQTMAKTKVSELGVDGLLSKVEQTEPDTFAKAKELGVDMKLIAAGVVKEYSTNSVTVGMQLVVSGIRRAITEATSTDASGFIVGAKDRYGRNSSVNFAVLNKDGTGYEVGSWDPKISISGVQQDVPLPAVATMKVVEEEFEKNGVTRTNLKLLSISKISQKNYIETAKMLEPLAINPSMITKEDCDQYKLVVVKGVISNIVPVDIWENKKKLAVGHNIVENNEHGVPHPVFTVNLNVTQPEGYPEPTKTRVTFDQRRFTTPNILMEDLIILVNHANSKFKGDPANQTREITSALHGSSVLIVGVASKLNQAKSKQGEVTNYLDISGYLIVEYPEEGDEDAPRSDDVAPPKVVKKAAEKQPKAKTQEKQPKKVADIVSKIQKYCTSYGITPNDISRDDVINKILEEAAPVGVIDDALRVAREEAEE